MMSECPKCGFLQPKDRYCANCGIDMETYTPQAPPWHQRLLSHPVFQLSAVVIIVIGTIAYIYRGQERSIDAPMPTIESPQPETANRPAPTPPKSPLAQKKPIRQQAPPAKIQHSAPRRQAVEALDAKRELPKKQDNSSIAISGRTPPPQEEVLNSDALATPERINIRFAQVPRRFLNLLFDESQFLVENFQLRAVTHKNTGPLLKLREREPRLKFFQAGRSSALKANSTIDFNWSYNPPEESNKEYSMSLQFTPTAVSANEIELVLEGFLHLKGGQGAPVNTPIGGTFSFNPRETLIVAGIVPHHSLPKEDTDDFSESPLSLMGNQEFLEGLTEFTVFIQTH